MVVSLFPLIVNAPAVLVACHPPCKQRIDMCCLCYIVIATARIVPPHCHHCQCHRPWHCRMSSTPILLLCCPPLDRLALLASCRPPPARFASSPAPPSHRVVHCPACLALSITPPPCVIQHLLGTQVIYLDLIVVFIIPVESLTSLFFENPADCKGCGPYHDHNVHVDTSIITPTHKPIHQHVGNGACQ